MPQAQWPHASGRPIIEVLLQYLTSQTLPRRLLADTGAGSANAGFEIVLPERDCLLSSGPAVYEVELGGAYRGTFPVYWVRIQIPLLHFNRRVRAVGIPAPPPAVDGIAAFRFLNRFTYGNFGDPARFGLET